MTTRKTLTAALFASVALTTPSLAADIDQQGADALKGTLTHYLPQKLIDAGFVTVTPTSERYEISVDWKALYETFKDPKVTINGLSPWSIFASPTDDGLWQLDSTTSMKLDGSFEAEGAKTNFDYAIGAFTFTGLYDPAILYLQSGDTTIKDITGHITSGTDVVDVAVKDGTQKLESSKNDDGTVDISSITDMNGFVESVTGPQTGAFNIGVDNIGADVSITGTNLSKLAAIVTFVLDHAKDDKLDDKAATEIKGLIEDAAPFWDELEETIDFNGVKVDSPMGSVSLSKFSYGLNISGMKNDAEFGISMSAADPVLPEGVLPPAYAAAVPTSAEVDVSLADIQAEDGFKLFMEKVDMNKDLSPEDNAAVGKAFLGGDTMTVVLNKFAAKSGIYDIEMSGTMVVDPVTDKPGDSQVTVLARDLDKTLAYLQENAAAIPEFGQAAFMVQMIKGFAVQDSDGRQKWVFDVSADGKVKINGTPFDFPK